MKKCFIVEGIYIHISGEEVKFREHKIKSWKRLLCLNFHFVFFSQMLLGSGVSLHLFFWGKLLSPKTVEGLSKENITGLSMYSTCIEEDIPHISKKTAFFLPASQKSKAE